MAARIPRVSTVMDLCRTLGWFPSGTYRTSPRAKPKALSIWHHPDYVAALQLAEETGTVSDAVRARHHLGTVSNPVFAQMYRRPATGAGGAVLAAVRVLAPRLLVLGGGGYNPWTVGRTWAAIWADLAIPDLLPPEAEAILRGLGWGDGSRPPPAPALLTTIADPPRNGPVRSEILDRIARLMRHSRAARIAV